MTTLRLSHSAFRNWFLFPFPVPIPVPVLLTCNFQLLTILPPPSPLSTYDYSPPFPLPLSTFDFSLVTIFPRSPLCHAGLEPASIDPVPYFRPTLRLFPRIRSLLSTFDFSLVTILRLSHSAFRNWFLFPFPSPIIKLQNDKIKN